MRFLINIITFHRRGAVTVCPRIEAIIFQLVPFPKSHPHRCPSIGMTSSSAQLFLRYCTECRFFGGEIRFIITMSSSHTHWRSPKSRDECIYLICRMLRSTAHQYIKYKLYTTIVMHLSIHHWLYLPWTATRATDHRRSVMLRPLWTAL